MVPMAHSLESFRKKRIEVERRGKRRKGGEGGEGVWRREVVYAPVRGVVCVIPRNPFRICNLPLRLREDILRVAEYPGSGDPAVVVGFKIEISVKTRVLKDDGAPPTRQHCAAILEMEVFEVRRTAVREILRFFVVDEVIVVDGDVVAELYVTQAVRAYEYVVVVYVIPKRGGVSAVVSLRVKRCALGGSSESILGNISSNFARPV